MKLTNFVSIKGHLTKDPEVKGANGWIALTAIAHNKSIKNEDGSWGSEGHFFEIIAKGPDSVKKLTKFKKGNSVIISGELEQNKYETTNPDGTKQQRFSVRIVLQEIYLTAKFESSPESGNEDILSSTPAPVAAPSPKPATVETPKAKSVSVTPLVVSSVLDESDFVPVPATASMFEEEDFETKPSPKKEEIKIDEDKFYAPTDEDFLLE